MKDIINIVAIIVGPLVAVLLTLWLQNRKAKRDAKEKLFLLLMAHRKAFPPMPEWCNALNVIDVVFHDEKKVVELWHQYYGMLANPPANDNYQPRDHAYLTMLSAMARSLGYTALEQTDIDRFYKPQAMVDQQTMNFQCQAEWLRVLQSTARFEMTPRQR